VTGGVWSRRWRRRTQCSASKRTTSSVQRQHRGDGNLQIAGVDLRRKRRFIVAGSELRVRADAANQQGLTVTCHDQEVRLGPGDETIIVLG